MSQECFQNLWSQYHKCDILYNIFLHSSSFQLDFLEFPDKITEAKEKHGHDSRKTNYVLIGKFVNECNSSYTYNILVIDVVSKMIFYEFSNSRSSKSVIKSLR